MPNPFDAALKELVQDHPQDWLAVLGEAATGPVRILTPDLSTVSAFADIVLDLGSHLLHLDAQSGPDPNLPQRVLLYNVLLYDQYAMPVHSIVLLLRPRANRSDLTGTVHYEACPGRGHLDFRFEVVRIWERPVAEFLEGGLGVLPLAPLAQMPEGVAVDEALPGVIERLVAKIQAEAPPGEVPKLLTAAFVLTGLRVRREQVLELFKGVHVMRESTAYQAILDEGWAKGQVEMARNLTLRLGRKHHGEPDEAARAALQAITDPERLARMAERVTEATGWQDLLTTP